VCTYGGSAAGEKAQQGMQSAWQSHPGLIGSALGRSDYSTFLLVPWRRIQGVEIKLKSSRRGGPSRRGSHAAGGATKQILEAAARRNGK